MHVGKKYSTVEVLLWTRRDIYKLLIIGIIPVFIYVILGVHWIALPWTVVALLGTATAFIVGFRNSQTYNRTWEARQIWGSIVNLSRTWGVMSRDLIREPEETKQLIYRHIAWLTTLRYALREPRTWETMNKSHNMEYQRAHFSVPEREFKLEDELSRFLSPDERSRILAAKNKPTQVLALQSAALGELEKSGRIDSYKFVEMQRLIKDLYDVQGRSERIKNFPYPRQFATVNGLLVQLFIYFLPFCMLNEFDELNEGVHGFMSGHMVWLVVPFSVLISWVFTSLDKVGESTENPFEGNANDVPISQISRNIEIDLREMLGESELPPPIAPSHNIVL